MRDKREFHTILENIEGKPAQAYEAISGDFDFTRFVLHRLRVTGDGAEPEAMFVLHVPQMIAGFPQKLIETPIRRTALEDYLAREVAGAIQRTRTSADGILQGATLRFVQPGPHILPRSAVVVASDYVEARLTVRLPLRDKMADARRAEYIFFDVLPQIVNEAMIYCYQDAGKVQHFVSLMEDADEIRQSLIQRGLVAFAAEGSRCSPDRTPLRVDETLRETITTPNSGEIQGLAVHAGVTLVIGDPKSGRHELVAALGDGVYNHIPEDGRAHIISVPDAVRVCAEPGRPVRGVDVSAFIRGDTSERFFSTDAATGSESQMATTMEALQAGAQVLIFDETDSNAAFLAADPRLRAVTGGTPATVIPLSDRVRQMAEEWRISVVIGAWACAGSFMASADRVIWVDNGVVRDVTEAAHGLEFGPPESDLPPLPDLSIDARWLCPSSIDPSMGREDAVINAPDRNQVNFGHSRIAMHGVPQVADRAQTLTLGLILYYAKLHHLDTERSMSELLDLIDQEMGTEGLDSLAREQRGDLARPRRFEIAAALNRLPTLRVSERRD